MICRHVRQIVFWGAVAMISCLCLGTLPVDAGKGDFTKDINAVIGKLKNIRMSVKFSLGHYKDLIAAVAAYEKANEKNDSTARKAALKEMKESWKTYRTKQKGLEEQFKEWRSVRKKLEKKMKKSLGKAK